MAKFAWEGKTRTGQVQKGEMEGPNQAAVSATLRRQGIMPSNIKERGKGLDRDLKIPGMEPKVTTKDLVVFTRQFATMIASISWDASRTTKPSEKSWFRSRRMSRRVPPLPMP
jgi:type II secretory pathway component PulF